MSKRAILLLIFFALLFILGVNLKEVSVLLNTGATICLTCIGVG